MTRAILLFSPLALGTMLFALACGAGAGPIGTPPPLTPYGFLAYGTPPAIDRGASAAPQNMISKISMHHPGGTLHWGGPDDQVSTKGEGHCGMPQSMKPYGLPEYIQRGTRSFLASRLVARQETWRWTGYYHGDWQIWQGDNSSTAYIVNARETRIAFEYKLGGCA